MPNDDITEFQQKVWAYYDAHGRHDLPWRLPEADGSFDPYKIWVSEMMLQQTQVNRVISKYESFLRRFPNVQSVAAASLGDVLIEWQGLGYNRRAKYIWEGCSALSAVGGFPDAHEGLVALPGIGPNTAGAILAYAYNREAVFIETNIRTVFIHHFFNGQTDVSDKAIRELAQAALPKNSKNQGRGQGNDKSKALPSQSPAPYRDWYWALMDYGTHIKQTHGNLARASKSYNKQSKFEGSRRQVRGAVIRHLSRQPSDYGELQEQIGDERLDSVLRELQTEGMVRLDGNAYRLS